MVLADFRERFVIQPKSIQGAGGDSRLKDPLTDGSKTVGEPEARLTGANRLALFVSEELSESYM